MKKFTHVTDVHLFDGVGSLEPRDVGKTWVVLFPCADSRHGLERGQCCARNLQSNPDYYFSEEKRNCSLCNRDGELYVEDGHHRTVIGRVFLETNGFEPMIKNVLVAYCAGQ
ncbi:hypothetical protein [Vibrio splendidus]|uniref:hypothetical protein n=1 Tax=Vibrio splendidus TaxID=29497 RepID=UPI003D0A4BC3